MNNVFVLLDKRFLSHFFNQDFFLTFSGGLLQIQGFFEFWEKEAMIKGGFKIHPVLREGSHDSSQEANIKSYRVDFVLINHDDQSKNEALSMHFHKTINVNSLQISTFTNLGIEEDYRQLAS
jgi:hypothetical protein